MAKFKFHYKNPYVIGGAILIVVIAGYFGHKAWKRKKIEAELLKNSAASNVLGGYTGGTGTTSKTATGGILITGHDAVWDYLYEGGRWYTKQKGTTDWIDMQNSLSQSNYDLAVSRLKKYL